MGKTYINSSIDIIDFYNSSFLKINNKFSDFENLDHHDKILYFTAGLALSNSIHEAFITSLLEQLRLTSNTIAKIKKVYKGPLSIENFICLLKLDLSESFEINKHKLNTQLIIINDFKNIVNFIKEQRGIRNQYLHGDYNINSSIPSIDFQTNLIEYQKVHSFLFSMILYSFNKNKINIELNISNDFDFIRYSKQHCIFCRNKIK